MNFALVPAAGRSSRLGRPKALLPLDGRCLLDRLVRTLRDGGVSEVVVISTPGEDRLHAHCAERSISTVLNPQISEGMLSSILRGVDHLVGRFDTASTLTICPVDFPGLRPDTVAKLLVALQDSEHSLVVPELDGRRGHPISLNAALAPELKNLDRRRGLRALFDQHPYATVPVDDPGIRRDLDTWVDYARFTA